MPRRSDSRERMLEATSSLLRRQGYHATGLNQIIKESGAPKGSLYFHFPGGKEELACAALEGSGEQMMQELGAVLAGCAELAEAPVAVAEYLARTLEDSAYVDGCPIATVALEAAASSDAVHRICEHHYTRWREVIARYAQTRGVCPERSSALAMLMLAAFEGALLLARAQRSVEPLQTVGAELRSVLGATDSGT